MSETIELVIIGSEEQANETVEGIPVAHRNMVTVNEFKLYFADLRSFVSILLLFFYSSNQILHPILKEIKKKRGQIIRVLICDDSINESIVNNMYIRFVSPSMAKYKIKCTIAQFIDRECMKKHNLVSTDLRIALYQQRTQILEQFHTNDELQACHILLIPLNATPRDVHNAEQRLQNICHELYRNEYTFIIHKLSDYIPEDENNPGNSSYTDYLQKRYKGKICHTIMKLSFIRMYVVENEPFILNKWSQKLVAAELDINQDHTLKYVDRCSFIINRPVHNRFTQDLVPIFGRAWQIQRAVPKTLDDVRDDIAFQDILPRIHGCLENRQMYINSKAYQQSLIYSEDRIRLSSEIRPIQHAINGPEEKQNVGDIKNTILA